MPSRIFVCALVLALSAAPAAAQLDAEAQLEAMLQSQAEAEAAAVRPGDEALTCGALEAELASAVNDPGFQAAIAAGGAWAEQQQARADAARGRASGAVAMSVLSSVIGSFVPGLGLAQSFAMRAQMSDMQAQAEQNQRGALQQAQQLQAQMPLLYRMQRIVELGQAQDCAFLEEQDAVPPG